MLQWHSLVLCALAFFAPVAKSMDHDGPVDLNDNAALKYWRAFALMPHLTSDEQDRLRENAQTLPLDAKVKDLVARSDLAFHELQHGAKVSPCAWSMNLDDGIEARLPEGQAARTLATLGVLRLRLRFEEKRNADALEDALALLKLSRDVSKGGTIIVVLVGMAMESVIKETLAANLPHLSSASLQDFAARLRQLPPMSTVAEAMLVGEERGFLIWYIRAVEKCPDNAAVLKQIELIQMTSVETGKDIKAEAKAFFDACGGTKEGVLKMAEEARPAYKRWARSMSLPLDQFQRFWEREEKEVLPHNVVMKVLAPALDKCRQSAARFETRQKLFQVAIAMQLEGQEALGSQRDPLGDGPFDYVPFDGGFELKSKGKFTGKDGKGMPITLVVGRKK